jgi:hypothetical protein
LLKLVDPAGAYVRQQEDSPRPRDRPGAVRAKGPGWAAYGPPGSRPPPDWVPPNRTHREPVDEGPSRWRERSREVTEAHRQAVERGAGGLLRSGAAEIPTAFGALQARLVRFWNGEGVLVCQLPPNETSSGRSFGLVDRRQLKRDPAARLAGHLMSRILSSDHGAHPELWGPPPPEPERVHSPGGWTPPSGVRPGWNWVPPDGAVPRADLMPRWVRLWYHTPFVDRFAHAWMWSHGGWDVVPPAGAYGDQAVVI